MIRAENIRAMVQKEFRQLFRDPRLRIMIVAPPIMMLLIFGYAANTDVDNIRFALVDNDRSHASREYVSRFTGSPEFVIYSDTTSAGEAVTMLDRGEIDFILRIQKGFSKRIREGHSAEAQVIVDGSDSSRASVVMSYIGAVTEGYNREKISRTLSLNVQRRGESTALRRGEAVLQERIMFNQDLRSLNFFLPSMIGLVITLITIMLTSMSIVKERESGTIEQINVSPLHPFEYIMGKLIPFAIVGFGDIIVITMLAIFWFDVPFRGSFIFLLAAGILYILSTLAVGLFISTISMTQQQAMLSSFLFFLPAILLSGFIFPVYSMPESIRLITYFNPMRYFMEIIRSVFLKGTGIGILWPQILALAVIGGSLLALSVKRYSKRMA